MKRVGNLWGKFISEKNIRQAIDLGTKFKRSNVSVRKKLGYYYKDELDKKPKDSPNTAFCEEKVKAMVAYIQETLSDDSWQPKPYRHIQRVSRTSGKVREIDCPTLEDHIIHWMLILTIQKYLRRGEYIYSCSSIKGRGIEYGRKQLEKWIRKDKRCKWFVKLDVKKFYPSIDQKILEKKLRRIIKDKKILHVCDKIIESLDTGLAIGNYTSQWFGNFYLQSLDHFILQDNYEIKNGKRNNYILHYLRYADDIILISESKKNLRKAIYRIIKFAKRELNVTIKPCWEIKAFDEYELDALGYRYSREKTTVRKAIFLHTRKTAKHIYKTKQVKHKIVTQNAQSLLSSLGWFSHADSDYVIKTYIKPYTGENELKGAISDACEKQRTAKSKSGS